MILKFIENDGVTGARLTMGERPIPDGSFLYRDGRYIRGGELGSIPAFATHRHAGDTLKHVGVNSASAAFSFVTAGPITFSQLINAESGSTFGNLTLADGSITDSSGAIDFGNENLTTSGTIQSAAIGCGIAPDATTIGKFYRDDALTTAMVQIEQDGTGDATQTFLLTGGQQYTIGTENTWDIFSLQPGAVLNSTAYFNMISTGEVGIGIQGVATSQLNVRKSPVNTGNVNVFLSTLRSYSNSTGAYTNSAFSVIAFQYGSNNNTGATYGMQMSGIHYGGGTLATLGGARVQYGNGTGGGNTTTAYGYFAGLFKRASTITNSYDFYCSAPIQVGGTATNEWAFYSDHEAPSRLIDDLQIADDSKYLKLGADLDSGVTESGTYMLFDCDLQSTGSRYFQFDNGSLKIQEIASAPASTAGYGQLYCKDNAGTTELWFVDDSGTETQLA